LEKAHTFCVLSKDLNSDDLAIFERNIFNIVFDVVFIKKISKPIKYYIITY
jgi:hypothetical protein